MPRYDFKCPDCGETFEKTASISERKNQICDGCCGTLKQLVGIPWQRIDINSDRWVNRNKKRG